MDDTRKVLLIFGIAIFLVGIIETIAGANGWSILLLGSGGGYVIGSSIAGHLASKVSDNNEKS